MLPFDLRYVNDIAFIIDSTLIPVVKPGIGYGLLTTYYSFGANLAKSCWLIDDYIIQFSSCDLNMYVYNMVTKKIDSYALNSLSKKEIEWMSLCCRHSNDLLLKVRELRNNPKNQRQSAIGDIYASYFNVLFCNLSSYLPRERLDLLDENIAFLNYNWDSEYRDGRFCKDGELLSFGEISRSISNLIRNEL